MEAFESLHAQTPIQRVVMDPSAGGEQLAGWLEDTLDVEVVSHSQKNAPMTLAAARFMESLLQPDRLRARVLMWAEEEMRIGKLPPKAGQVLEAILYRGELRRGELADLLGVTARHARRIVASLAEFDVLASDGPRDALRLAFPAALAGRWMPGLFPERQG